VKQEIFDFEKKTRDWENKHCDEIHYHHSKRQIFGALFSFLGRHYKGITKFRVILEVEDDIK